MIVKMAIAKENFIDANESPNFQTSDNFLQCLQKIFPFVDTDILEFDGNSFQMINSYDPTNSIFIYTNQQGTFLYTITSATPRVHKNNMIWNCLCYKMEDVANIEDVLSKKTFVNLIKNKFPEKYFCNLVNNNKAYFRNEQPTIYGEVKDNFESLSIEKIPIAETLGLETGADYVYFTLKIKCTTDLNLNLNTKTSDGSFNFYFPFILFPISSAIGSSATMQITNTIKYGNNTLTLENILKQYSENIKSIELLPFFFAPGWTPKTAEHDLTNRICAVDKEAVSEGIYTQSGLFSPYSTTISGGMSFSIQPLLLLKSGGCKGFVKTPLGNIQIDFNNFYNLKDVGGFLTEFNIYVKEDGWFFDGLCYAEIPPHYLNFYTDETSQLFIANMTTNAQELRQINREYDTERSIMGIQKSSNLIKDLVGSAFKGNFSGILGSIGGTALDVYTELSKAEVNYNKNIENYKDKIKTQELLASMTGKQISGNISFTDAISYFNNNYFEICLENNFATQKFGNDDTYESYDFITQKNYDYSVKFKSSNMFSQYPHRPIISEDDKVANNNIILDPNGTTNKVCLTKADLMALLFGYQIPSGRNYNVSFRNYRAPIIHLNYQIAFSLINYNETQIKFTENLSFNIRK